MLKLLLILSAMLFVLLAVVSRYYLFYMKITSETTVGIAHSSLMVVSTSIGTSPPTWSVTAKTMFSPNTAWTPSYVSTGRSMSAALPCVYPAGLSLCMLCVHHFRTRKRVGKDECTHCGYNVSQLTVCPECGTAVT